MYISKATQNITIKALKLLFFALCLLYIIDRLHTEKFEFSYFVSLRDFLVFSLLMVLNWGLEGLKWRVLISSTEKISFKTSCFSVLTGLSFGLLTPNRVGNFIGKIIYLEPKNRVIGTLFAFYGNFSQLVSTLIFGSIAFVFYHESYFGIYSNTIAFLPLLFSVFFLVLFLRPSLVSLSFAKRIFSKEILDNVRSIQLFDSKISVFGLSVSRHLIFTIQYLIVLSYSPSFDFFETLIAIQLIFLYTTMIPSIMFGKIIIRETVAVFILTQLGYSPSFIINSILFIWLLNIALPSLVGSLLLLTKRKNSIE